MILELTTDQRALLQAAEAWTRDHARPVADTLDESDAFPRHVLRTASAAGLTAVSVPADRDGGGHDALSAALAIEAVARGCASIGLILAVTNVIVELLAHFGTGADCADSLKQLIAGLTVGTLVLPLEGGSVSGAHRDAGPGPGGGFTLRGGADALPNALAADVAIVGTSRVDDASPERGGLFLVPLDAGGVDRGRGVDALGIRGAGWASLTFSDVTVSDDRRLAAPKDAGAAAAWALERTRILTAAVAIGVGQAALDEALAYTRARDAGGSQGVRFRLADIATELDAARMLVYKAATLRPGDRPAADAAMARLYSLDAARRAADRTMELVPVEGYRRTSTAERLLRDAQALQLYPGRADRERGAVAEVILD